MQLKTKYFEITIVTLNCSVVCLTKLRVRLIIHTLVQLGTYLHTYVCMHCVCIIGARGGAYDSSVLILALVAFVVSVSKYFCCLWHWAHRLWEGEPRRHIHTNIHTCIIFCLCVTCKNGIIIAHLIQGKSLLHCKKWCQVVVAREWRGFVLKICIYDIHTYIHLKSQYMRQTKFMKGDLLEVLELFSVC